jgi:broad specificity phosphatase PhoE
MRLILVRHGQTACNVDAIWHGWDECELTQDGLAQARAVGARLAKESIAAVYSSPSRRAMQTAEQVAAPHGLKPVPDLGLRERNAGEFEGIAVNEVVARHPTVWEERNADYWNWRPPGGESFQELLDRVLGVVRRLETERAGQTVAIATHMGPVRVLTSYLTGVPLGDTYAMTFPSTGISIFSLDADRVTVEALNDTTHVL